MLKNYIRIAVRNILKHKGYSFLNIAGLAIGMACCILILLYVQDELSYDKYHSKSDRIYRVAEEVRAEGVGENSASMPFPFGPAVVLDYPDLVEASVRFFNFQAPSLALEYLDGEKQFNEPRFFFVDSTVFQIFDFAFVAGDPGSALDQPNSVVLTQAMARKYFGEGEAMGKVLRYEGQTDLKVTGIVEDVPENSHFQFDFLASFSGLKNVLGGRLPRTWYWNPCWTYVLLAEGASPEALAERFPDMVAKYFPPFLHDKADVYLQPLRDIHLNSHLDFEIAPNSDISYVYIFSAIAVFILLIACINFMNLATARSAQRSLEVGMRKALGAFRSQLIKQFLGESVVMSLVSGTLALGVVALALPYFNDYAGKTMTLASLLQPVTIAGILVITLFVGLVAGLYPALFLSAFEPVKVLKGTLSRGARGGLFRKTLVVVQFAISIILIIGTGVSYDQLTFLQSEKLGFNKEQVVLISLARTTPSRWYDSFKSRILQNPDIVGVTMTHDILGSNYQTDNFVPEGYSDDQQLQIPVIYVTHDFLKTFEMELVAGRAYIKDSAADSVETLIVNESAVAHLGWTPQEAIGKRFGLRGPPENRTVERIVGVVKDFNYTSLRQPIGPFVVDLVNGRGFANFFLRYVAVRIRPGDVPETIGFLRDTWREIVPQRAFEFTFLDQELDGLYKAEENWGKIFTAFAFLAIFIACLGLFALAAFTAELRTKEVGIRKVMGASANNIVLLLSKEFVVLLVIASCFAWPAAFYAMERWLQGFAFRTQVNFTIFGLATVVALVIALLTVGFQALKAALANPIDAIKYE